jgi:hypothetical protein
MTKSLSSTEITYDYKSVKGTPKPAWTYRAARRNAAKGTVWHGATTVYYRLPPVRENKRDRTDD